MLNRFLVLVILGLSLISIQILSPRLSGRLSGLGRHCRCLVLKKRVLGKVEGMKQVKWRRCIGKVCRVFGVIVEVLRVNG